MGIGLGSLNPTNIISQAALTMATGGTSLIAQAALRIGAEVAKEVIQNVGQQLGLPQPIIDAAEGSLSASIGDYAGAAQDYGRAADGAAGLVEQYGNQFGGSPSEIGDAQRDINDIINDMTISNLEQAREAHGNGRSGKGWLMAMAEALGRKLDKMAREIEVMSDQITDKTPSMLAKYGAKTQEFGIFMNAAINGIKTIGEAESGAARKG